MDDATALQLCLERDRLLSDPDFARSPSMCKLLRFLVEYKLSENTVPLKSYTIATDALGRDANFDTQTDSYPRVQMGRLRRMLDNFYLRKGGENRLSIPPSKYEIILEANTGQTEIREDLIGQSSNSDDQDEPPATPEESDNQLLTRPDAADHDRSQRRFVNIVGICLLVALTIVGGYLLWPEKKGGEIDYPRVAFDLSADGAGEGTGELAEAIENHLVRGLQGFGNIRIFDLQPDQPEKSGYVIRLRFMEPDDERIELRLIDAASGEILWSQEYSTADEEALKLALDKAIVALASNYGEIAQAEMSKTANNFSIGYPCLIQFDLFLRYRGMESLKPVRECLKKSVERFPNDAHLMSVYAFSINMARRFDGESASDGLGMELARRAEALDRNSATANFAVSQSAFLDGDCATGLAWGDKAIQLNPLNSRLSGYLGLYMISCNDPEGEKYAVRALELDPNADVTIAAVVAFQMLKRREAEAARKLSLEYMASSPREEPALELTYILSSAMLNDKKEARRAWKDLAERYDLSENSPPREVLRQWIASPSLINQIMFAFERSGMFSK